MKTKFARLVLLPVLFLLCLSVPGQTFEGSIQGTLTDQNGAALPGGEKIVVTSINGLVTEQTYTDPLSSFSFSALPLGSYILEFTMPRFQGPFRKKVRLDRVHPAARDVRFITEPCGDVDGAGTPALTDQEGGEILRQMLAVYLPSDAEQKKPTLSSDNIKPEWLGEYRPQFVLMAASEISRLGQKSKFPYLRISNPIIKHECVSVVLSDLVSAPGNRVAMSGGAKTYEFRKVGNHWVGRILISWVF